MRPPQDRDSFYTHAEQAKTKFISFFNAFELIANWNEANERAKYLKEWVFFKEA